MTDFRGYVVPVASKAGGYPLKVEAAHDPAIEAFITARGNPDYIYVVGRFAVKLIYRRENEVVTFRRTICTPASRVEVEKGIPAELVTAMRTGAGKERRQSL